MACALFAGSTCLAQDAQGATEVTYTEDASQGYLFNRFKDNWFITAEGGADLYFNHGTNSGDAKDRMGAAAGLYGGKWFSPIIGLRAGVHFMGNNFMYNGAKQKFNHVGPVFDAMINLTNWWCGYHPGRIYNLTAYIGAGGYITYGKTATNQDWHNLNDGILNVRAGIINSFNVSKQVQLSLDIRWTGLDNHGIEASYGNRTSHALQAYLGVTYLFKNREWKAPVVPVCPEVKPHTECGSKARLEAAEAQIASLEGQLKDCMNRKPEVKIVEKSALATIYYPIGVSSLTQKDKLILSTVADVMKNNPNTHYTLTGWADNYTGNSEINDKLRKSRVDGVKAMLIKYGVPESQITANTEAGNRLNLGEKYVVLDRAVTIEESK